MLDKLPSIFKQFFYVILIIAQIVILIFYWTIIAPWIQTMMVLSIFGLFLVMYLSNVIDNTIGGIVTIFTDIFKEKPVKQAMSVLGKESGRVRALDATTENIATQVLNNPQIQGWKMIAKTALGIDLDEMIEEHGAVETLAGLKQIGDTLGLDIPALLLQGTKGLNTTTEQGVTTGQYLKG